MTDLIGALVGSIRIDERLGGGGMGEVFRGFDTRLERTVAVKTVRADRRLSSEFKQRFRREARLLSKLGHPGICQVYDLIETPAADFLVLEYLEGATLDRFLETGISRTRLLGIFAQVANALAAAHGQRVVHRDLKPENIHIGPGDRAKILDFGIARNVADGAGSGAEVVPLETTTAVDTGASTALHPVSDRSDRTTAAVTERVPGKALADVEVYTGLGEVVGTRGYMSPEQAAGQSVGTASDIYALGLCLDRALERAPPVGDEAGRSVAALVARMLAGDPQRRPDAAEVERELLWLKDQPRRQAGTRVRRRLISAAAVALLLLSAAMAWLAFDAYRARTEAELRRAQAEDLVDYLLGELREQLLDVGRVDLLDSINQRGQAYLDAAGAQDSRTLGVRTRLFGSQMAVLMRRGDYAAAEALAQATLPGAQARVDAAPDDVVALQVLAEVRYWLGYVAIEQMRELTDVLPQFDALVELRKRLLQLNAGGRQQKLDLALALSSRVAARNGRGPEALADAQRAVALHRATDRADDIEARGNFAAALGWLSSALELSGDLAGASAAREENVAILGALADANPDSAVWSQDLAVALHFRAVLAQQLGQDEAALTAARRSCGMLLKDQQRDPENREYQRAYPICLALQASILMTLGRYAEARVQAQASVAGLDRLIEQAGPKSDWPLQRALSYLRLAEVEQADGQCAAALLAVAGFDRLTAEQREGLSRNHQARRQLLAARCAMAAGTAADATAAYAAVLDAVGEIGDATSIAGLALAAVVAIETGQVAEQNRLLALLGERGYRGSMVINACRKAGRTTCLQ